MSSLSRICGSPSIAALAVLTAACGCSQESPVEPPLVLHHEPAEHPADDSETTSPFRLENRSARPVRVIGFSAGCFESCCARVDSPEPVVIPPGATVSFVAYFKVGVPGPFEAPIEAYLDDGALKTITLKLTGIGRPKP